MAMGLCACGSASDSLPVDASVTGTYDDQSSAVPASADTDTSSPVINKMRSRADDLGIRIEIITSCCYCARPVTLSGVIPRSSARLRILLITYCMAMGLCACGSASDSLPVDASIIGSKEQVEGLTVFYGNINIGFLRKKREIDHTLGGVYGERSMISPDSVSIKASS